MFLAGFLVFVWFGIVAVLIMGLTCRYFRIYSEREISRKTGKSIYEVRKAAYDQDDIDFLDGEGGDAVVNDKKFAYRRDPTFDSSLPKSSEGRREPHF